MSDRMRSLRAVDIAAAGLGVSLVVFFAGATAAVAAGASPPTAMWAAGGAVSGGLLGLLAPPPVPREVRAAAIRAKKTALSLPISGAAEASGGDVRAAPVGVAPAAPTAVNDALESTLRGTSWGTIGVLAVVFTLLLTLAVVLAGGAITPPDGFGASLQNLIKTIAALASAAGTGVIGLLAPAPSTP